MHRRTNAALVSVLLLLAACSGVPTAADRTSDAPATPPHSEAALPSQQPELVPPGGHAWFGMNLDWGSDTIHQVSERLGVTPAVWVHFVRLPLTDGDRANLMGFFEQVGQAGAHGLITLEPHDGLDAVTPEAAAELASVLDAAWTDHGVATFVRFAHEMNGSWYAWGQ